METAWEDEKRATTAYLAANHSRRIEDCSSQLASVEYWKRLHRIESDGTPCLMAQYYAQWGTEGTAAKTSSSSSLKHNKTTLSEFTMKNSMSASIKSRRANIREPSVPAVALEPVKEVPRMNSAPLAPSKSKSDYCIRYDDEMQAQVTYCPLSAENQKVTTHTNSKLSSRHTSRMSQEKVQKKFIATERLPAASVTDASYSSKILDETVSNKNTAYCQSCRSRILMSGMNTPMEDHTLSVEAPNVAPPPAGYFVRDDMSTEESGSLKKKKGGSLRSNSKPDVPSRCTFGYDCWSKSRESDKSADTALPIIGVDTSDSVAIPKPKTQSPRRKKRSQSNCSKESPKKKLKKVKKRKNTRKSIDFKEQSPKKTKVVDDCSRNQPKKSFDLKTGIAFRHIPKNDRSHPIRYKQKILDPNHSKFFQTMGSLPVSMDSVLYYYEPQVKSKTKRNMSQNRNVEKSLRGKGTVCENVPQDGKGLSWMKICDTYRTVYLNRNANANTSDEDQAELDDTMLGKEPKTAVAIYNGLPTFNEITGMLISSELLQGQDCSHVIQDDSQDTQPTNGYSLYAKRIEGLNDKPIRESLPLLSAMDRGNSQYGLDLMVDDILESAIKEEVYDCRLMEDTSDKPEGETGQAKGKTAKSATFSLNLENNVAIDLPQKRVENDEEHANIPISKSMGSRPEMVKTRKALKRVSSSSPNLSMARKGDRIFGGKQQINSGNYVESPSRSKSTSQTNKLATTASGYRCFEKSPDIRSPQSTLNCKGTNKKVACGIDVEESNSNENVQERGRPKLSRDEPSSGSILRKSKSVPQGEKRTQPNPIKWQRKRKPIGNLKKSQSMSPGPLKGNNTVGSGGTPTQHSGQSSGECLRKKTQTMAKKNKKKVRIVVDWNSGLSPKEAKDHRMNLSNDEERNSKNACEGDADPDSSCDSACYAETELKGKFNLDRTEINTDDELENEMRRETETENEDGEKIYEDEQYNIICGFSGGMKESEKNPSMNIILKDVPIDKSKMRKPAKTKKVKTKEDKATAEKGWDSHFVVKREDSKTKIGPKRKRYQLRKPRDHGSEQSKTTKSAPKEINEIDQIEVIDTPVDLDKASATKLKKPTSPQMNRAPKLVQPRRSDISPTGLRRKMVELDPRGEGSSVDAPVFNARRESAVRFAKANTLANAAKQQQSLKETQANAPRQRVKQARETFAKIGRNRPSQSPLLMDKAEEISPQVSRSTDLDLVCCKKQLSPNRGAASTMKTGKQGGPGGKPRGKSEPEGMSAKDAKDDTAEEIALGPSPTSPSRMLDPNFTSDPVEMNVLNLGLHWVAQHIMKRLSFFKSKPEEEEGEVTASPVFEKLPVIAENEKL